MQERVRGMVCSWPGVDSLGPLRGSKTSEAIALDVTTRHSTTSGKARVHPSHRVAFLSSPSRRILSSSKVELLEPSTQARLHGYKDRDLRSRVRMDTGERKGCAPTSYSVEGRIHSVSRKDPKSGKDIRKTNSPVKTISKVMEGTRHCDPRYPRNPRPGPCQSPIYCSKGQDRRSSHHRPFRDELARGHSKDQDGAFTGHDQVAPGTIVGSKGRRQGRLLVSPNLGNVQEILLLLGQRRNVDVQEDAVRLVHCSLDLHPLNEGNKEVSKEKRRSDKFFHRRLHSVGIHKASDVGPSRVDEASSHLVRIQDKSEEDICVSSAVSDLPGSTVRSKVLNSKPSSRQDHQAQESLQCHVSQAGGLKSRSGRTDRVSYIFVFGYPPRADVCDTSDCLDERAHLCGCPSCQNICYFLSASSVEAFLQGQLLRSESFIQNSGSRPGSNDGCFRLWLEWSHSAICYKGHLVGIGSIQIHQREGNVGNHFLHSIHELHPGWQACGYSYGQRGSIFLFKENGFSTLTSTNGPGQAISVYA